MCEIFYSTDHFLPIKWFGILPHLVDSNFMQNSWSQPFFCNRADSLYQLSCFSPSTVNEKMVYVYTISKANSKMGIGPQGVLFRTGNLKFVQFGSISQTDSKYLTAKCFQSVQNHNVQGLLRRAIAHFAFHLRNYFNSVWTWETRYRKIASSNTSRLEAHEGFFRLLMKGIFGSYVLWPFDKKLIF